jgi:four helix bundle protein
MKNFRTYQLAKQFYGQAKDLKFEPPARDQFKRALLSICLNLSEGSGKSTAPDRARFYSIALGSLREVQALLELFNYKEEQLVADQLGAMIFRLIQNPGAAPLPPARLPQV